MRQLRQTLRLHLESGLSLRECSRVLGIGKSTIADIVRKARAAGVDWAATTGLLETTTDERVVLTTRGRLLSNELFSRLV